MSFIVHFFETTLSSYFQNANYLLLHSWREDNCGTCWRKNQIQKNCQSHFGTTWPKWKQKILQWSIVRKTFNVVALKTKRCRNEIWRKLLLWTSKNVKIHFIKLYNHLSNTPKLKMKILSEVSLRFLTSRDWNFSTIGHNQMRVVMYDSLKPRDFVFVCLVIGSIILLTKDESFCVFVILSFKLVLRLPFFKKFSLVIKKAM